MNLKNYVTADNYTTFAGPDWPSYDNFLLGARGTTPGIQQEINDMVTMFKKDGTVFPIRTQTSCLYKWSWSTIYLNMMSTASCHRAGLIPFNTDNFENFHNLPKKIQDRELMLQGQWPKGGCNYCKTMEEAGGISDRSSAINTRGLIPPELDNDPTAVVVSPTLIEIFAQNTCNLACVYCNGDLSSKIAQENKKFGTFKQNGVILPEVTVPDTTDEIFERFLSWLRLNVKSLRRLHLLGGETFIQHRLMNSVLDILKQHPNPNLQFTIFSNLNVPDQHWQSYTEQIHDLQKSGNIQVFDLTASIDCWGPEQEYIRSGLNLEKFENRFAWAAQQDSWLKLTVNQTITSMGIKTMPGLIEKINYYRKYKNIDHYFQFVGPNNSDAKINVLDQMHPKQFAYNSMWQEDFEKILSTMSQDQENQRDAVDRMIGVQKLLQQHQINNWSKISSLHTHLDELDRRRHTDWRKLFSYLDIHEPS